MTADPSSLAALSPEERKRWTRPGVCRNPDCPHGRPEVLALAAFGQVIAQLCPGCTADSDAAETEETAGKAVRDAVDGLMRGVREPMRSWTLGSFPAADAASRAGLAVAEEWVAAVVTGGSPRDLVLHGRVGRGKTGLAWGIAHQLASAHGVRAAFANFRELLEALRESYDDPTHRPNLNHLRGVPVLVLDDLGAERPTEWAREQLASLVDWRNGRLWTVYTSNYALSELAERLGHDDPVVGQRIVSRIAQASEQHELGGPDRRISRSEPRISRSEPRPEQR